MVLLPPVDLLEDRLSDEVPQSVVVVVSVDDVDHVLVVAALDPSGDRDLRQDLLLRFRQRGCRRHGCTH